jgi:hypothetical protein
VNLPPKGDFEEIATLTAETRPVVDPVQFKTAVAADVCRVGGDVVVTEVNGYGQYVRGTVLRHTRSSIDRTRPVKVARLSERAD